MDFYKLAKTFFKIKSPRVKLAALLAAHVTGRRYIGIFIDPVMTCNLKCRMCYFSDPEKRPKPLAPITDFTPYERSLFRRALKLQIGCGAEPTLYRDLPGLIRSGRNAGIPYIEITTNGQLLDGAKLEEMVDAGLNGITLSVHGTTPETYEYLMDGGKWDRFIALLDALREVKSKHPDFQIRINYTINNMNAGELAGLPTLLGDLHIDTLQMRPIQQLGETAYADFDLQDIYDNYDRYIAPLRKYCADNGITCISPEKEDILKVATESSEADKQIEWLTYCYVSAASCYHPDFDLAHDTFESYHKRRGLVRHLVKLILTGRDAKWEKLSKNVSKKLNYSIK